MGPIAWYSKAPFAGSIPVGSTKLNVRAAIAYGLYVSSSMKHDADGQFNAEHTGMAPVESVILQRVILTASTGFESSLGSKPTGYSAAW